MVLSSLEKHGVGGEALELEITESVIMANIEETIPRLERLVEHGISIAVDDFGTGYSSLRYLARLPVAALKIDRSFIVKMTEHTDDMTLVTSIISLAHALGLKVVAEGVDSEEQAKFLRLMKCDIMQGYLFGRPQSADEIARLLKASASRP
jgi:EAL domain-containing protein (putative c-di-GMP-specific phosphodiesterase class I)